MNHVEVSSSAEKDLRRIGAGSELERIVEALGNLSRDPPPPNLDTKSLVGRAPWRRLRVGSYRILYRSLTAQEMDSIRRRSKVPYTLGVLVGRVVHRRDLDDVVRRLG